MRRCLLALLALIVMSACPGAGNNSTSATSTGPALTTGDQPTGGTTDACEGSGDCNTTGICVADYEAVDTEPPTGMRDAAECVAKSDCIGPLDLGRWCFDHRGCCENLRCHPADGTCEPRGLGETTSSTGDTDATTTTGDASSSSSDTSSTG